MNLETNICKAFEIMISERFGHKVFIDFYYDFESHEIVFYDIISNINTNEKERFEAVTLVYNNIIKWIKEEFKYKLVLKSIEKEDKKLRTLIVFKLTKSQEETLSGFARIKVKE